MNIEIDLPEKKNVLSSISDNDLLNELIDRSIANIKYSDREKLFEIVSETCKKRLLEENILLKQKLKKKKPIFRRNK